MIIILFKTDQPEAEIYLYADGKKIKELKWQADRQLAETIHLKIEELLEQAKIDYSKLDAVGIFSGPGSFTGLRISHSVANSLAHTLNIPILSANGDDWQEQVIGRLLGGEKVPIALPEYGRAARITTPRK